MTKRSDEKSRDYGINVVDVRIKRADLPQENERAVFGRMRTERERQAKKYRSEGQEEALKLRAAADRERTVILAESYRNAQVLRGEGDAEATKIYAAAYNKDPEFYSYVKTLETYEETLGGESWLLLTTDSDYLKYLKGSW